MVTLRSDLSKAGHSPGRADISRVQGREVTHSPLQAEKH